MGAAVLYWRRQRTGTQSTAATGPGLKLKGGGGVPALLKLAGPRRRLGLFAVATLTHKSWQKQATHHGRCSGRFAPLTGSNESPGPPATILGAAVSNRAARGGISGAPGTEDHLGQGRVSLKAREGQGLEAADGARRCGLVRYDVSFKAMGFGRDGSAAGVTKARGKKAGRQGGSGRGARRSSSQIRTWLMSDVLLRLPTLGGQRRHDKTHGERLGRLVLLVRYN
jgi:hypothetical protein